VTSKSLLHQISRYLALHRAHRKVIIIASIFMLLETALAVGLLYAPRYVFDVVLPSKKVGLFWLVMLAIGVALVIKEGLGLLHRVLLIAVHKKVSFLLMIKMIKSIYSQPVAYLDSHQSGYLRARIMADVAALDPISISSMLRNGVEVLFSIISFSILIWLNYQLSGILLLVLGLHTLAVCVPYMHIKRRSAENSERWACVNTLVQEKMQGIKTTILFNKQRPETRRLAQQMLNATRFSIGFLRELELATRMVSLLASLGLFSLIGLSLHRTMLGRMTLGEVVTFLGYSTYFFNSTATLFVNFILISATAGPLGRIFQILDERGCDRSSSLRHDAELSGHIEFDHVSFSYTDGVPVLRNLSFKISAGERIAIVGRSGAGKTTILNLMLGFYRPTSGSIRLDGFNIQDLSPAALRRHISYVSQDTFLFNGSIRDNISYSNWQASDEEVEAAAQIANLDRFIKQLPAGYNTSIGELGSKLSSGQRQRLAIARIMLLNPQIILLDEVTCHQDQINEQLLLDAIRRISRGKTLIIVSHSTSILQLVDRILLLDNGQLVAEGNHRELYERVQLYRDLCDSEANYASGAIHPSVNERLSRCGLVR